ncbi:hypothetical protein [uncultured Shewanella sp.]|uniref:hypothetical protein n=1 Tax=uncultured Shewanella sp. TaxID=173975 RepID=UPI00260B7C60|nr:hypothetical protein [uncultured Shewanella sp.]
MSVKARAINDLVYRILTSRGMTTYLIKLVLAKAMVGFEFKINFFFLLTLFWSLVSMLATYTRSKRQY